MKVARNPRLWLVSVVAYSVGGAMSSAAVGATLGWLGKHIGGSSAPAPAAFAVVASLGLILAARERGWLKARLPERQRQTEQFWAQHFGAVPASLMWGLDLGLGFTTRINYGGWWFLVALALLFGSPSLGSMCMLCYWLGRVLPVWIGPLVLSEDDLRLGRFIHLLLSDTVPYRRLQAAALIAAAAWLLILSAHPAAAF